MVNDGNTGSETTSVWNVTLCRFNIGTDVSEDPYAFLHREKGARGGAVGCRTVLQVGRSRVRFPMVSLEFFVDIVIPAAIWPWG